ncbi:aminoglycoside phosphotransferase family protein [Deinococcus navajonensis]|uniref:Aminoglycoside phosphotransferase family protein n=1 Tax=Deinococcus navajonensis TaxID=309884 RepID=A0ABV8XPQ8_9DEIO
MNAEVRPDLVDARRLLGTQARFLAQGATCTVFTDGHRVVRLGVGREARLRVQVQLQQALAQAGVPVAEVLEAGTLPSGRAFSVERRITADRRGPGAAGWADLGYALRTLHTLPHRNFGLLEDRADQLVGQAASPAGGLLTRLPEVWPLGPGPLSEQSLVKVDPTLAEPLAGLQEALSALPAGPAVVGHTDLHPGQLLWRGGRLAAILDFGDAAIGPASWDSASLAYFHGWAVVDGADLPAGQDAALLGLLLSFHRARRARTAGQQVQAAAFAWTCLRRLGTV